MIRCRTLETPFQVEFSSGGHTGVCDAPADKGGQGQGFRPHELLEAALGSCTSMIITMYAKNHGIALTGVSVDVSLDRSEPGTTAFHCAITLSGDLTDEERQRLLRAARACPVRKTLSAKLVFREQG
ncbi:OsmC family protein [Desulfovibrio sp. JY]|nr:OsmC family protein [Desulfovibrio sp. JY]